MKLQKSIEPLFQIYALVDPRTDEVRYVGCTVDPAHRLRGHRSYGRRGIKTHAWIAELEALGLQVKIRILKRNVSGSDCLRVEQEQIRRMLRKGANLTNIKVALRDTNPVVKERSGQFNAAIRWRKHVFPSAAAAGRHFKVSSGTIFNILKRNESINGAKLKRIQ